jgi:DNA-binding protein H-NS
MSNYKLKLNQIREVLNMPIKFETAKLKDGTVVEVEKLEVGFPVVIVNEDGSKTPAPEGEHVLEDGKTIEVDANGVISEISAPEVEESVEETVIPAAMAEETIVTEETPIEDEMTAKIEEKMAMLFQAIEECAAEISKVKEEMGAMKTKMEKFAKAPAAAKISKTAEVTGAIDTIEARVAALKNLRSEFVK